MRTERKRREEAGNTWRESGGGGKGERKTGVRENEESWGKGKQSFL